MPERVASIGGGRRSGGALTLDEVRVARADAETAVVDVRARAHFSSDDPVYGKLDLDVDYSGPVELVRRGGEWRVDDWRVDGRRRSDTVVEAAGEVADAGLVVESATVTLGAKATGVSLRVRNTRASPVLITDVRRGHRFLGRWRYLLVPLPQPALVPAGETVTTTAHWRERFSLRTRELRFVVRAGETEGPQRFELQLAVRRGELADAGPVPRSLRRGRRARRLRIWAPLAAFVVFLLLGHYTLAGAALVADALWLAWFIGYVALQRYGSPRRLLAGAGAVVVVAATGVWIAATPGSRDTGTTACDRSDPAPVSDAFLRTLRLGGLAAARPYTARAAPKELAPAAADVVDVIRTVPAAPFLARRRRESRASCYGGAPAHGVACFRYLLAPGTGITVETVVICEVAEWRVWFVRPVFG